MGFFYGVNMIQEIQNGEKLIKTFEIKADSIETLESEKAIIHYISTSHTDRGRDIVNPKGMNDKDFQSAPTVWYNHAYVWNPNAKPVAKSLWRKKQEDGVLAKTQFSKTSVEADDVYSLHKEGIINTWSIGFNISADKNGNVKEGAVEYDAKKNITYINEWDLLEYSSAPLAMNPKALDQVKSIVKSDQFKNLTDMMELKLGVEEQLKSIPELLQEIASLKSAVEDLINLKTAVERIDLLEKDILDLTQSIETKQNQITERVDTLGRVDEISKNVIAGEVSRFIEEIKKSKEKK